MTRGSHGATKRAASTADRRAPAAELELRPLTAHEATHVPGLWNAAWSGATASINPYPLTAAVWGERLASRHHDPRLLLGAFDDDELVAVAHGKTPVSPWQPAGSAWVSLLAVAPDHQGRGVGTRLTAQLLLALAERGSTLIKFGADADHLLPGPPQESGPAVWRLLRHFGARFGPAEHDLHLDLRPELAAAPLAAGWSLRDDDSRGAIDFVSTTFPGRWAEELTDYVAAGAVALTLVRTEAGDATSSAEAQGFCAVFLGGERATSPGLIWGEALHGEIAAKSPGPVKLSGVGPLGLAPTARGAGLGLAMVRGAADYLQRRGATDLIINWTTLTGFYGRLGARIIRTYQRAEAPSPALERLRAVAAGVDATGTRRLGELRIDDERPLERQPDARHRARR